VIESRRYDAFLTQARIDAIDTAASPGLSVAEVGAELTALGYTEADSTLESVQRTRHAYEADNRLRFTVDGLGSVSERVYDAAGQVVMAVHFAARPTLSAWTEAAIDGAVNRSDPANQTTRFVYDAGGRQRYALTAMATSAQGQVVKQRVTEQVFDGLGRV